MQVEAHRLVEGGVRKSTAKVYNKAQKDFLEFCHTFSLVPVPVSENTLLLYIANLNRRGLAGSSMQVYLSAVRNLHSINGKPEPDVRTPKLKLALKAVGQSQPPPLQKAPITIDILAEMWEVWESSREKLMFRALVSLGFFTGMRGVEYTYDKALRDSAPPGLGKVCFLPQQKSFRFRLDKSKTNSGPVDKMVGCSGKRVCAYCSMLDYLKDRASHESLSSNSALFVYKDGSKVDKVSLSRIIKQAIKQTGRQESLYSAHSLRSGVATSAAQKGFKEWEVKQLGGWRSNVYMRYIRQTQHQTHDYSRRLTRESSS